VRHGFTLPELLTVLGIVAVISSVAIPPFGRALDRAAVREGVERFAAAHAAARQLAVTGSALAKLEVDAPRRSVTLSLRRSPARWDTVASYSLGSAALACSNPTLVFGPLGVGYGTSNTRVIFARGAYADTVTTSRTGRLRR
jgi:prepilin-type N-terminal cleavage/methylation domain-containing protein